MTFRVNDNLKKYFEASFVGATRGVLGLVVEHPFDTVKTRCHAKPVLSTVEVTKQVYQNHGFRGFYTGAIPNGVRLAVKQMYRFPMMLALPPFYKKVIPADIQKSSPTAAKVATGLTIASFETYIICPLERLKIFLMTNDGKTKKLSHFFQLHKNHLHMELLRGLRPMFGKQVSSWVSFLVADEKIKTWEKRRLNVEQLSFPSLMKVSAIVGAVNTAASMPFDMVKTNLQKQDHMENRGLFSTMARIQRQYGFLALYRGWQPRLLQYMIQSAFTVSVLDKLESKWNK